MNREIIESDFNKKLSTAYQLSILVGMDSLVYFIFDAASENVLLIREHDYQFNGGERKDVTQAMKRIFSQDELLSYLYRRVRIALCPSVSALVPARLYNEAEKTTYLAELLTSVKPESVCNDELSELGVQVVYQIDNDVVNTMKKQFPTCRFFSHATPFLLGCRKMLPEAQAPFVFAHLLSNSLSIAYFEGHRINFYNTFNYASSSDALYYILLAYDQFGLEPSNVQLVLSGHILENSEIYRMLTRYVGHLQFIEEPSFLKFGKKFSDIPQHFYFDLYSLSLCK